MTNIAPKSRQSAYILSQKPPNFWDKILHIALYSTVLCQEKSLPLFSAQKLSKTACNQSVTIH